MDKIILYLLIFLFYASSLYASNIYDIETTARVFSTTKDLGHGLQ